MRLTGTLAILIPKTGVCIILMVMSITTAALAKDYELRSPDKKIAIKVSVGKSLEWSVMYGPETILLPSAISLQLAGGLVLGQNAAVKKAAQQLVHTTIEAIVPVKSRYIRDEYTELRLTMKNNYAIVFRAYNNGVAYRFETTLADSINVVDETAGFNFPSNNRVLWSGETNKEFQSHYESAYKDSVLNAFTSQQHAALPLYTSTPAGTSVLISEADLYDYPNLFLFGTGGSALTAGFPKVILERKPLGDRTARITQLAGYIARTNGARSFPWRYMVIGDDKTLLEANLAYQLSRPNVLKETAWIQPGKVAWDWWNANNVYGVNFKAGLNTATYKYYVDFAAAYGLEYIILDEGWSLSTTDLLHAAKEIDLPALIAYANAKKVGVILWALWEPLDKNMDAILDQYVQWGVKGVKVDFMARADQYMVNYYERVAAAGAKRHLLVDLHGAYKPVGLNRKYPNVISYEGVRGLENCKWSADITPGHDVTLPFTRMVAGPMDFTPGAMLNGNKKNFHIAFTEPISQGTRAHQVAMYVVYESPLQMLADNPSNYLKDPACTGFIAQMPTVWDTTIALHGKAGDYVAIARKSGRKWYIGAMTNWTARDLTIPLSFLGAGSWKAQVLADGLNAAEHAADYAITTQQVTAASSLQATMSGGGGWCAVLSAE